LLVGEHLVGVGGLLELLLGLLITAALIGVVLLREPPVRLLQVRLARATLDPEYFIKITHDRVESTLWVMRRMRAVNPFGNIRRGCDKPGRAAPASRRRARTVGAPV